MADDLANVDRDLRMLKLAWSEFRDHANQDYSLGRLFFWQDYEPAWTWMYNRKEERSYKKYNLDDAAWWQLLIMRYNRWARWTTETFYLVKFLLCWVFTEEGRKPRHNNKYGWAKQEPVVLAYFDCGQSYDGDPYGNQVAVGYGVFRNWYWEEESI